jgi:hypothetical protein
MDNEENPLKFAMIMFMLGIAGCVILGILSAIVFCTFRTITGL